MAEISLSAVEAERQQLSKGMVVDQSVARVIGAAAKRGSGVVITVDEMQHLDAGSVRALGAVFQRAADERWPAVIAVAGLPAVHDVERITYFERATWNELSYLDLGATRTAFSEPAAQAGKPFEADALDYIANRSRGYPYAVQVYADFAWRAAGPDPRISLSAAQRGVEQGQRRLDSGLYRSRWRQSPRREKEYLRAVAEDLREYGRATGASVARRLNAGTQELSYARDRLIKRGTLNALDGELTFAVPGMESHVLRQEFSLGSDPDFELD